MKFRVKYYIAIMFLSTTMLFPGFVDDGYGDFLKLQKQYGKKITFEIYLAIHMGSNQAGISKGEVAALMKSESDFDIYAVSCAGARGLCQVMPYNGTDLFNPFSNVFYGMKYYRYCLNLAKGNRTEALRFYNAGPASVRARYKNWAYVEAIKRNTMIAKNVMVKDFFKVR